MGLKHGMGLRQTGARVSYRAKAWHGAKADWG